jgi:hypothetical protein
MLTAFSNSDLNIRKLIYPKIVENQDFQRAKYVLTAIRIVLLKMAKCAESSVINVKLAVKPIMT